MKEKMKKIEIEIQCIIRLPSYFSMEWFPVLGQSQSASLEQPCKVEAAAAAEFNLNIALANFIFSSGEK